MTILKWICFILVCLDTISYIAEQIIRMPSAKSIGARLLGLLTGIVARVYVLYGAAVYWLLA